MLFYLAKGEIFVPKKLNDTQVLEIVTKHANGTSISALAREYGIARTTITRYIEQNADLIQKCADKKEETVTEWLKAHTSQIQGILNMCIDLLPAQLKKASARDIVGVYKIMTETQINTIELKQQSNGAEALDKICEAIKGATGVENGK